MKKKLVCLCLALVALFIPACSGQTDYVLNEKSFFLVMTNMQYYPEQYLGCNISLDCFTYRITDIGGNEYMCGVRKCSAGYGCTCGQDTVIGFILSYDGHIPEPVKQSEDTPEKAWIHIDGKLKSDKFKSVEIHSYKPDGSIDYERNETIKFLEFNVSALSEIKDYSGLNYYVTK